MVCLDSLRGDLAEGIANPTSQPAELEEQRLYSAGVSPAVCGASRLPCPVQSDAPQ